MMEPQIKTMPERYFIGLRVSTSLVSDQTGALWRAFMPRRKEIENAVPGCFFSIQFYGHFDTFTPQTVFEKWAAVEVTEASTPAPPGMHHLTVLAGMYAVFVHKGLPSTFSRTLETIFSGWLPSSVYNLDDRPHMEVMNAHYNPTDPLAEEEVWIPVRLSV